MHRVDGEQLSRAEPAAADPRSVRERHGARLRGDGDEPVVADSDAQGPQAVPVELGP